MDNFLGALVTVLVVATVVSKIAEETEKVVDTVKRIAE